MSAIFEHQETAKHALDAAIGAGAITSPVWLQMFNDITNIALVVGGLILLGLRIMIAWREWRARK